MRVREDDAAKGAITMGDPLPKTSVHLGGSSSDDDSEPPEQSLMDPRLPTLNTTDLESAEQPGTPDRGLLPLKRLPASNVMQAHDHDEQPDLQPATKLPRKDALAETAAPERPCPALQSG